IQDDHVNASLERADIADHVGLDGSFGLERRRLGTFDRDVHLREGGDVLTDAVFVHFEVLALQVWNELPVAIEDRRVDLDVVDLDFERDGWLIGRWLGRPLLGGQRAAAHDGNEGSDPKTTNWHDGVNPALHWQPE